MLNRNYEMHETRCVLSGTYSRLYRLLLLTSSLYTPQNKKVSIPPQTKKIVTHVI